MIFALGCLLRLPRWLWGSVWYDEFLTIRTIRLSWQQLFTGDYPKELHPPLYFLLLKSWTTLFGLTDGAMRSLSVLLSVAGMIVLFLLVRQLVDRRVALGAILLFAVHPAYIHYATEIRMYALLILCSLGAFLAWTYYSTSAVPKGRHLITLAAAVVAALYTHYFGVLVALGIGLFSVARLVVERERRQLMALAALAVTIVLYMPWAYSTLWAQSQAYQSTYTIAPDKLLTWRVFPALFSASTEVSFARIGGVGALSLLTVLVGVAMLARSGRRLLALVLTLLLALAACFAFAVSATGVEIVSRYLLHISVFALILAACALVRQERTRFAYVPLLLGLATIGAYLGLGIEFAARSTQIHPNWRMVSAVIAQNNRPNEPIVILGWDAIPIQFYLSDHTFLTSYDLEGELSATPRSASYILVESRFDREIALPANPTVLLDMSQQSIRVLRLDLPPAAMSLRR
jgi:uncharacterized membrane protein